MLGGYDQLLGYEHNAKIYRDAQAALSKLRARAPWEILGRTDQGDFDTFVTEVETVLQHEINQWGQLTAAYEPPIRGAGDWMWSWSRTASATCWACRCTRWRRPQSD